MRILATVLTCAVVLLLVSIGFIYSGLYDVSALTPDPRWLAWALHTTSDHSVDARLADIRVPPHLDDPEIFHVGAHMFAQNCTVCHGGPGLKPTDIAQGLNPKPPDLFRATRKPWMEEMFRFIKYGVKMTAMPAFGKTLSDDEIWKLCVFLRQAPGLSAQKFASETGVSE